MERLRPVAVWVLVAWTLLLWAGRLHLAWTVTDDSFGEKVLATVPVAIFVVFAVVVAVATVRQGARARREGRLDTWPAALAGALAVWTLAYWLVRLPLILANDHDGAFKAVHAVLAIISWAAAAAVLRVSRRGGRRRSPAT